MTLRLSSLCCVFLLLFSQCEMRDRPLADATDLFEKAVSLYDDGSYQRAESLFVKTLPVFERAGQQYTIAEVHRYIGQICMAEGRYYAALGRFKTSMRLTESLKDFRNEMVLNGLIGDAYAGMSSDVPAFAAYGEAHRLSAAFNDPGAMASLELRMGRLALFGGHVDDALSYLQSATAYLTGKGGEAEAEALGRLGEAYFKQKKYDLAQTSFAQARTAAQKSGLTVLDARLRMDLGLIQRAQGNFNEALQWFRDAVNNLRSKKTGKEQEVMLLFRIGNVYEDNGRYADARKYYADAEEVARAAGDGIAEGYLRLFGIRCEERGLNSNQKAQEASRFIQAYQGVARKFQQVGHASGESFAHAQVGRIQEMVGNTAAARDEFREAIEVQGATLGEFLLPDYHRPYLEVLGIDSERVGWYTELAGILIQLKAREEALAVVEIGSQRQLSRMLQESAFDVRHPDLKPDVLAARSAMQELRMLQIEQGSLLSMRHEGVNDALLNGLHTRIAALQRECGSFSDRIAGLYPNYEPLLQPAALRMKEIQSSIPPGTLVIRFLPAAEQLHVFALTRSKFEIRSTVVPREKLLSLVNEYMRLLNDPSVYTGSAGETSLSTMTRFAALSTQLYDYLLRPVDPMFERNLVIVASPEFDRFPFHAIERQDKNGAVKYLIELTSVDYLPTLGSIRFKTNEAERISKIVALGNPTGKNWSIDYELRDIRSFFKEATIFIGKEASWENLKGARADVLQISSDFVMSEGQTSLGVIGLAKVQNPDEVVKIPFERLTELPAPPLFYLSNQYGQGVGLSTAHALVLRMNGTSDVFLNAWFSDRKTTKFFSEFFFTQLANGLAPGDAYRQALLNLIRTRDVSHPHSWGQFFHFGVG
ncbi:MAG TPA: tetratricopeptide repeat protein [Bacteroidota bacterium]|nr:tetratricopeptide repeat protein [Bacteroidota bacterium]